MTEEQLTAVKAIMQSHPVIKLVYLFGSQASGQTGPLSDYDFAIYLDNVDRQARFELQLELMSQLGKLLKTEKIDVVVLNDLDVPELAYAIIRDARILYAEEPYQLLVEPRILNQYFDFHLSLKRHGLTRVP